MFYLSYELWSPRTGVHLYFPASTRLSIRASSSFSGFFLIFSVYFSQVLFLFIIWLLTLIVAYPMAQLFVFITCSWFISCRSFLCLFLQRAYFLHREHYYCSFLTINRISSAISLEVIFANVLLAPFVKFRRKEVIHCGR